MPGTGKLSTHVVEPGYLCDPGVRLDVALEVDVHALPEGAGVEGAAQLQRHDGHV